MRRAVPGVLAVLGSLALASPAGAQVMIGAAHHPSPKPVPTVRVTVTVKPPAPKSPSPAPTQAASCAPMPPGRPVSEMTRLPWAEAQLGFDAVWPLTQGAGVTVAIIDSGVNAIGPQLSGRISQSVNLTHSVNQDCVGHGTSVASIIGATDIGPPSLFYGVAPEAKMISIKYTNSDTDTNGTATISQGIVQAVQDGANVINISSQTGPSSQLQAAVLYAESRDVVIVASSGNLNAQQQQSPTPAYPANYSGVLSVGAVGPDGKLAGYSNSSSKVSVVAPGSDVTSLWAGGGFNYGSEGTSFAAPFVAGTVALVRAAHPGLSYLQVEHRIQVTADGGTAVGSGYGLVNPVRAVTAVLPEENAGVSQPSPRPQAVAMLRPHDGNDSGARFAEWFVPGALAAAALAVAVAFVVPAGRRRGWRPGGRLPIQ